MFLTSINPSRTLTRTYRYYTWIKSVENTPVPGPSARGDLETGKEIKEGRDIMLQEREKDPS
jgi:hypothetical protein